jgi:type II secretory pathway pseudopilin PulG
MPNHLQKRNEKYKFTLIELLTVIAVITVLMGMSIGVFSYVSTRMAEARTRATIAKIESALETYKSKYGMYPTFPLTSFNNKQNDYFDASTTSRITAFYLEDSWTGFNSLLPDYEGMKVNDSATTTTATTPPTRWIVDYFGGAILYRCPGYFNRNSYDLGSLGSDGKLGDNNNITDANVNTYWGKGDDITNFTRKE